VTQTCPDHKTAKGYTIKYNMTVSNGRVFAQHGTEGKPDSLTLTGQIKSDGTAALAAKGLTGPSSYSVGNVLEGLPVSYPVPAQFNASRGAGERTKDRPCTFSFEKV
jgi:hypothetical protein